MNDLVAVGPRSFYATSDHLSPKQGLKFVEDLFLLPLAYVSFFDGSSNQSWVVAPRLNLPNGMQISRDGTLIFVSSSLLDEVLIYQRDKETNSLEYLSEFQFPGPDNIFRDEDDVLWIAGHPIVLQWVQHALDASNKTPAPSYVERVEIHRDEKNFFHPKRNLILSGQKGVFGASVAAHHRGKVIVGSVFDDHLLFCNFK
jgi:arylesterase/paraoxonase